MNRKKKKETVIAVMVIAILFLIILLGGIRIRILGSSTKDIAENIVLEEQQEAGIDDTPHSVEENKETKLLYSFTSEQMQQEMEKLVESYYTNLEKEELYSLVLQTVKEQYGDSLDTDSSADMPDIAGQLQLATGDIENIKTLLAAGSTEYDSDKASLDALIHTLSDRIASVEGSRASNEALWELKEELNNLSSLLNHYMATVDKSLNGITLYTEEGDLFGSWTDEEGNLISKKLDFAQ